VYCCDIEACGRVNARYWLKSNYRASTMANEQPRQKTFISISISDLDARFQYLRFSQTSGMKRASACCDGLERCNGVQFRGGRRRRNAASRGAAGLSPALHDTIVLVAGQHSFRMPACPRFRVSRAGPNSTNESSSDTAGSARARRSCSTLGARWRCASFRVERATSFSLLRW
jgi:hypothetical protein